MNTKRHGLSIGIERSNDQFFLYIKAVGKLSHNDYNIITPMIDSALEGVKLPKINLFFDASELEGWELRAAWDDFKLGFNHQSEFIKIAILGNKKWHEYAAKIGAWFIEGEIKNFDNENDARKWLNEHA
jgi:hypothetical protein